MADGTNDKTNDCERGAEVGPIPKRDILYSVNDVPPWHLTILLGFQHYLTALGGIVSVPIILASALCLDEDYVGLSELIGTIFFVSGLVTVLQSTFGVRLPIVQGGTFTFLVPTFAILSSKFECEYTVARDPSNNLSLSSLPEIGSEGHRAIWQERLREIQGAIMVSALFQVVIGFTGLIGLVLRFIGPLSITPTIALTGLSLFGAGSGLASKQWWIALTTMVLIALFSQYLRNVKIPCCTISRDRRCSTVKLPVFSLFPVLLAMVLSWVICAILTAAGALPSERGQWGYEARTDTKIDVLEKAKWFRFPYPGQWGVPTVSVAGVFGMLAGVLASMVESVGDYYACARLSGAPPPPIHAVNRGIGMEGIGCLLAGAWGSGNGTTSYSENVGAIGITKVGSRRVIQVGGCFMLLLGCLGKFGALFATIPDPVVGGMFMIMFGMVAAVGLSYLQYVDLNSSRNIFILGVSMFFGLSLPMWMQANDVINTGNDIIDQIFLVLLRTSMFVGGLVGFVLDNTIPGTEEERGLLKWRKDLVTTRDSAAGVSDVYSIPSIQKYFNKLTISKYLPFCPNFAFFSSYRAGKGSESNGGVDNPAMSNLDEMEKETTHM